MKLKDFDYNLPQELIAQEPINPRDHSRLLVLDKRTGKIEHRHFFEIGEFLQVGDVLVLNDSKVFPARLIGEKAESGGKAEVFLLKRITSLDPFLPGQQKAPSLINGGRDLWQCLLSGRSCKVGMKIKFSNKLEAVIEKNNLDGTWQVRFNIAEEKFMKLIEKIGQVPLPPYIKRSLKATEQSELKLKDKKTYQTVFANEKKAGSVAAPTAGLHFTEALIKKLKKQGVQFEQVTLHVGLGTFASVKTEKITEHKMHSEWAEVDKGTLIRLLQAKKEGRRIITVGTTATRTLETVWQTVKPYDKRNMIHDFTGWTDIFIYPGYEFKAIDGIITNFHVPKSTLLMLVSALAQNGHKSKKTGLKKVLFAYDEAIKKGYRFFSYGDAMLVK
ncbi:MAG: S-adenosylmethionine:tRNA ribosyltransferase-isomerase [Parcubacteria group bacterium GW2011_GWE2_39_37]|uniref:S-adenosylmethionine:tRNA ribosyltransferase-isomerase n=1 Tax=Candidatus Falkowbacteria bacterium GW2011_GWF2_39_8 TaxID=1618642 RepID=A0A0G0PVS8_9BACT|nr:MAG: S-adenosylmethionine:tRNA ribosyltransferase-isomerase [Parcubacteria group bacterium GW2011_GWE2_39_37]KKR32264.1 MAG: S-adenosylmethionine:tRNA ribosyltransferase-isomerase [Candidatus Falkowbacteria bacterium GW2011_GWF2_39_8]